MIGVGGKYDKVKEAVIFKKCLGLNDIAAIGSQKHDPQTGETELIDCLNVTTTRDGCIEKTEDYSAVITHSATVTSISADNRFIYQDAVDTNEWTGTDLKVPFALKTGTICHTPLDVRLSSGGYIYKSINGSLSGPSLATVGNISAIPPSARSFSGMPLFNKAFVYNAKLYTIEPTTKKFMQFSEDYHYDVYALSTNHLSSSSEILDAGFVYSQKPDQNGCILWMHSDAVSVLDGSGPHDFTNNYYPCQPIIGSLYSGWISKALGYGHVFMCADGIYMVSDDGVFSNLTVGQTSHLNDLNSTIYGSTVKEGKYLAYGNNICVEYDFFTKTALKRSTEGVTSVASWQGESYFAQSNLITKLAAPMSSKQSSTVLFPYSYMGAQGTKAITDMYFTGRIDDSLIITAIGQEGKTWTKEIQGVGNCSNYRIKTPRTLIGNRISISLECHSGAFRLEELRANYTESQRSV